MYPELTNLLPTSRIRADRQGYFMRLAVVAVLLLSGVVLAHAILLLPTYIYTVSDGARA